MVFLRSESQFENDSSQVDRTTKNTDFMEGRQERLYCITPLLKLHLRGGGGGGGGGG
jgi:hypothetical protein